MARLKNDLQTFVMYIKSNSIVERIECVIVCSHLPRLDQEETGEIATAQPKVERTSLAKAEIERKPPNLELKIRNTLR